MELLLIRHGLPERIDDAGGPADPALSEEGTAQAERLADWLAHEAVDAIYSSPMRRARETAAPLAARLGMEVTIDDELSEFDRELHFYIPLEELKASGDPRYDEALRGIDSTEVDAGRFQEVVTVAVERVIEANPSRLVAVFCHGGVINAYTAHVLGLPQPMFFLPHYTSVNRVLAGRGVRSIQSLNELGHLVGRRD